jgi:uncharacterized membrane protein
VTRQGLVNVHVGSMTAAVETSIALVDLTFGVRAALLSSTAALVSFSAGGHRGVTVKR